MILTIVDKMKSPDTVIDAKLILRRICKMTFFVFQAIFAHLASKLAKSVNMTSQKCQC
jgi:hypothetical protein